MILRILFCFFLFFFSFSSMPSIHSNDCNSCLKSQTKQFITQTWLLLYRQDLCLQCSQLLHLKYLNHLKLMQIVHYGLLLIVNFFKLTKDYIVCPKMAPINEQHVRHFTVILFFLSTCIHLRKNDIFLATGCT